MLQWMHSRRIVSVTGLFLCAATLCSAGTVLRDLSFFAKPTAAAKTAKAAAAGEPVPAPFAGVSLSVNDATVPPGGIFQYQLLLTEPKPMGRGSTTPTIPTTSTGPARGLSLNDPSGQACGVAVQGASGLQVNFISPNFTFGTNAIDYPILTITFPVKTDAVVGTQVPLNIDLNSSFFIDPATGLPYPQESAPGKLTIGGHMSITDVLPGEGLIPAGTPFSITGMNLPAAPKVQVEGATVVTADAVSSSRIDVTLDRDIQLQGTRIRVIDKNTAEKVTYYSYLRANAVGQSLRPLLAASYPIFSSQKYTSATLPWTKSQTVFTGLALQNPNTTAAPVKLELLSSTNQVLQSLNFLLESRTRVARDLLEVFPLGIFVNGASVRITSAQPIQMLGLQGDTSIGAVAPLVVTPQ
ncbi:MAG: hypothetical protein DMG65_04005 [Candidatus Angelobacter sp. Gp1-AA117]|nr:MAG: hypothetical protein DMG65_04005 [Candidatus Angelobacter sp. Gp1-AA117]